MAWSEITNAEVLDEFTPQEKATLNAIQGADGKLPQVVQRVARAVRGAIIAGGGQVGTGDSIPDQLRPDVIDIARWRWLVSFPQLKVLQTRERKDAHDQAQARIDKVSAGTLKVEVPDDVLATTAPSNAVQSSANDRVATRTKLNGLT